MKNKCHAIDGESIYEIEDKINEFIETHDVFSSQVFLKNDGSYDSLIWFHENQAEPIIEKPFEPPTERQINALKKMGKFKENMSKQEAWVVINQSGGKNGKR